MLGALTTVEVVPLSDPTRTAVRCAVVLSGFAGMAVWARWNGPALDQADWCACAGEKMTVRVIPSRRPMASRPTIPTIPVSPLVVEVKEEIEPATR